MFFISFYRRLFYRLPIWAKFLVRRLYYLPADIFSKDKELMPPRGLIFTGRGNFAETGKWLLDFFKREAGLSEEDRVLDIGSGIGRIAIPLTRFLKNTYHGFDIVPMGVNWCKKNISSKFTNFHFDLVDVQNDLYKKNGASAGNFIFPYDDRQFDFICAISLFTHLLPSELENYFKEMSRVLDKQSTVVATFFIIDDERRKNIADNGDFSFPIKNKDHFLMDNKVKAANVAYELQYLQDLANKHKINITKYFYGTWNKKSSDETKSIEFFQDLMVFNKK